uniref:Uncharacterized protein n=1 Tax=Meloidogyne enterolobii TaxID=390850 RepID=A0A6V7XM65_MELEN|nr:unnamed protein product [Meloidogyne enterolobii]
MALHLPFTSFFFPSSTALPFFCFLIVLKIFLVIQEIHAFLDDDMDRRTAVKVLRRRKIEVGLCV